METTAKGYIDLDKALLDFNAWEQELALLVKDNAELKMKVKALERQCSSYEKAQTEARSVAAEYLTMSERLQAILLMRCDMEAENGRMKKEIAEMKKGQKLLEEKHAQELKNAMDDLEAAQEAHKMEIAVLQEALAEQNKHEMENLQRMLQTKTNENKELLKQITDSEKERQHEFVKLRLEYDSKILQLQKQASSVTMGAGGGGPSINSDIFRKKLQHMRQESSREVSNLKQVISDLERKLATHTKGRRRP